MLELAILHNDELQARYKATLLKDKYRYYSRGTGVLTHIALHDNTWEGLQLVSVDNDIVLGYVDVSFNRYTKTAYDLAIMSFAESKHPVFTADLAELFMLLFKQFGIERIVWSCVKGNPIERFYDRLAKYGMTRIVGTFTNEVMLADGALHDLKYYETIRSTFLSAFDAAGATPETYRNLEVD